MAALLGTWAVAALIGAATVRGAPSAPVTLTGMRSWSSPAGTRIVFDFSAAVAHVAPDSGVSSNVQLSLPGEPIARAEGVPAMLGVRDGVVDSVTIDAGVEGARLHVWFRDSTRFHVLSLPAQQDKPYRVVVDATRLGALAEETKRLEGIAAVKSHSRVRIVAVDAGHGGEDTGARGPRGVLEKRVTMAVARGLVDELNKIPGIRGVLTRDGDYFIPLRDRYRAAEKMKADVFISIHANSSKRRGQGRGTEVFFLSLRGASDQADADLADIENAADLVGGVPPQSESDLVNILYDVKRSSALQQSQLLAESLLDRLAKERLESRGVKQAGFVVLKSVEFPSVLVETAFINNPVEARLLNSRDFQLAIARQLAAGVKEFFQRAGIGHAVPGTETGARVGG
ncbi:MAG TPA: N-acetylmuramoyl-L-alanine amidase [Candidatus Limnocylindria bacterium]|nr:N-acetylmuramoyl-L-alanine amidase [Candidatus Limnocylindria bacterium]